MSIVPHASPTVPRRGQKVWIDADTGNEMDDVYAIIRMLAEPSIEVVGLSSAHFNNADLVVFERWNQYPTQGIHTVGISEALNVEILRLMRRESVPHFMGADRQIGRSWGGTEPRPCPAVKELIAVVEGLGNDEYLDIIAMAALTNVASAVMLDPTILPRIRCHALAGKYDVQNGIWSKNEFNVRGDLNAFDFLLDHIGFDLTLMPVDVAKPYCFTWDSVVAKINEKVPAQRFLKERWQETNPQDAVRVLWDLALVEAYLLPQYATVEQVAPPPENAQRPLKAYTSIDAAALTNDFWRVVHDIT